MGSKESPPGEHVFGADFIEFRGYPFAPAAVTKRSRIAASEVREIDLDAAPPSLRAGDEVLFVWAPLRKELADFAKRNGIRVAARFEVWPAILEPYFDVEPAIESRRETVERLWDLGIDPSEADEVRLRVERPLRSYTFDAERWGWTQLGLCDVLWTVRASGPPEREFEAFYHEAMRIALRSYRD